MAPYDRQFEIIQPADLNHVIRYPLPPASMALINPEDPTSLIDGELVQINAEGKYIRATTASQPSFLVFDERGHPVVRTAKRLSAILGGASFYCRTLVYDTALTTIGAGVGLGTVNNSLTGSVNRAGFVAVASNYRLGTILRVASPANGNRLEVLVTGL